jgi:hypothetical protein
LHSKLTKICLDGHSSGGTIKIDVKIVVDIVLKIKAILVVLLADIQALIKLGLGLNILLGLQLTVFLNLVVKLIVVSNFQFPSHRSSLSRFPCSQSIVAILKIALKVTVDIDLHLVLAVIADIE